MTDDLALQSLSAESFAPFGEVIGAQGQAESINYGRTLKFADQARIDVSTQDGRAAVHVYRSQPVSLPFQVSIMERHPLASQAFVPLRPRPFIVIVAPAGDTPDRNSIRAFLADGTLGVNLRRGVWHHHHVALEAEADILVIDRAGPGANFEEWCVEPPLIINPV